MSRIALIIGNPMPDSLDHALAEAYRVAAADGGATVRVIDLAVEDFEPVPTDRSELRVADRSDTERLGPAIQQMIETILWADHLVFVHPVWWGTYPAVLKGFIDRVFLSGVAFQYRGQGSGWDKLLAGRTARILVTMDAPNFFDRLKYRRASEASLKNAVLWYCGVKTLGVTRFDKVRLSTPERRARWIVAAAALGKKDADRRPRNVTDVERLADASPAA